MTLPPGSAAPLPTQQGSEPWTALRWTADDATPFGGPGYHYVLGGTAWSGGFVLVGEDAAPDFGAIWSSPDGLHWTKAANEAGALDAVSIRAVAAEGTTLVAVGIVDENPATSKPTMPVGFVWVSHDGVHWTRVADPNGVIGREVLVGVVAGPSGFVAFGYDLALGPAAAVLFSTDGMHWTRLAASEGVFAGADIAAMVPTSTGYAAVGSLQELRLNQRPIIGAARAWWSTDGVHWQAGDVGQGQSGLTAVQPWAGSLRAIGDPGCGGCIVPRIVWRSTDDGRSWHALPPPTGLPWGVDPSANPAVLVGERVVELAGQPWAAGWSADGTTWHPLATSGPALPDRIELEIADSHRIVAVAARHDSSTLQVFAGDLR